MNSSIYIYVSYYALIHTVLILIIHVLCTVCVFSATHRQAMRQFPGLSQEVTAAWKPSNPHSVELRAGQRNGTPNFWELYIYLEFHCVDWEVSGWTTLCEQLGFLQEGAMNSGATVDTQSQSFEHLRYPWKHVKGTHYPGHTRIIYTLTTCWWPDLNIACFICQGAVQHLHPIVPSVRIEPTKQDLKPSLGYHASRLSGEVQWQKSI